MRASDKNSKLAGITGAKSKAGASGLFSGLLSCYDSIERMLCETACYKLVKLLGARTGAIVNSARRLVSAGFENSRILSALGRVPDIILEKSLRYYGVTLFFFGIFYAVFALIRELSKYGEIRILLARDMSFILPGVFSIVTATVMMTSQASVASQLIDSRLFSWLLFDVLCFDRKHIEEIEPGRHSHTLPIIIGMLLSIFCIFVSPLELVKYTVYFIVCCAIFKSPENGIIFSCLVYPFFDSRSLMGILMLVSVSYLLKVFRMKRVFRMVLQDFVLLAFAFVVLFGGIYSPLRSGSLTNAFAVLLCLFFGFIVSNVIQSSALIERVVSALIISCTAAAFAWACVIIGNHHYGFVSQNMLLTACLDFLKAIPFSNDISSLEITAVLFPFVLIRFARKDSKNYVLKCLMLAFCFAAVFVSRDVATYVSFAVSLVVFIGILKPAFLAFAALGTAAVSLAFTVAPKLGGLLLGIVNINLGLGFDYTKTLAADALGLKLASEMSFLGYGSGTEAVSRVLSLCFGSGAAGAASEMSLLVSLIVQYGIPGVFTVLAGYGFYIMNCCGFFYRCRQCLTKQKVYVASSVASVTAFAVRGLFFPAVVSLQSLLVLCLCIYICISIKKSAIMEYVPTGIELINYNYN